MPVPFDNYEDLEAAEGRLLFVKAAPNVLAGDPPSKNVLQIFTAKDRKVDYAMSNSFGFGGHDASLLFKKIS